MTALAMRPSLRLSTTAALPVAVRLALLLTAVRAIAMLGPVALRPVVLLHSIVLALMPWILLTRPARAEIGPLHLIKEVSR
jgi:hypothetical protein